MKPNTCIKENLRGAWLITDMLSMVSVPFSNLKDRDAVFDMNDSFEDMKDKGYATVKRSLFWPPEIQPTQ